MMAKINREIKLDLPSELENASHKLKGSMLQFSAHSAAAISHQLEEYGRTGSMAVAEKLFQKLQQEISELQQGLHAMLQDGAGR